MTVRRTPEVSLRKVFLLASLGLAGEDDRAGVVAEALDYLQRGFENHYAADEGATDEEILAPSRGTTLSNHSP